MSFPRACSTLAAGLLLTACSAAGPEPARSTTSAPGATDSTSAAAITPAPTALDPAPEPRDYALGTVQLEGGHGTEPFALQGTVAFPPGAEAAPVALVLHMRGNPCTDGTEQLPCGPGKEARYDQGMGWLASALAARGYVALVPDITATRDFRHESVSVSLGYQLGLAALERLRTDPAEFGVPDEVTLSEQTATIGHSVGGDQALWAAIDNPGLVSASILLEPAPALAGMFPSPDNPFAYLYGREQTAQIPHDLPFAVVIGRCDDDAGYQGGQYTVNATVDPRRTAPAALGVIADGDHVMLNTRATRDTTGTWPQCPEPSDAGYPGYAEEIRMALGQWSADVLDVFLGRQPTDGQAARRAGLNPHDDAQVAGTSVVSIPPADARTTVLLPLAGAMGRAGQQGAATSDPIAGAATGITHSVEGLESQVCPAGAGYTTQDPELASCASDVTDRPGEGPALHLVDPGPGGAWTAALDTAISGSVLVTVAVEPDHPATRIVVRAGGSEEVLAGDALAVPASDQDVPDRSIPVQLRLDPTQPVSEIVVEVHGGGVYLQDVFVVA